MFVEVELEDAKCGGFFWLLLWIPQAIPLSTG